MGKVSSAVHTMYAEGRMDEAIKLFNDRQDFFYFLLTPEVWYAFTEANSAELRRSPPILCIRTLVRTQSDSD